MSRWNSGDGDASDELLILKNKLNVQDAQLAAQQTQIMKQTQQLSEYQTSLNDTIHKLNQETQRTLQLEKDLRQRTDHYQSQSVSSKNVELALTSAREAIRAKDLEVKELQTFLDTASRASDESNARTAKLEREKSTLEARVRELEAERKKALPNLIPQRRTVSQPRFSSTPEDKIKLLEKELEGLRSTLSQAEKSLHSTSQKLSQTQDDLIRSENEKTALEKRMTSQLNNVTTSLEEKDAELQLMKKQAEDGSREEELIKRIEEDEAKITTLESILRETQDSRHLKARLQETEIRLSEEAKKVIERDERCIDLVREKEEALDQLANAREEIQRLTIVTSSESSAKSGDMIFEPTPTASLHAQLNDTTVGTIERLLAAVDRLRVERDDLRRDVQFLESESRFTIESLEAKLSASTSTAISQGTTGATQSKRIVERSALVATASAVVIRHLDFRYSQLQGELFVAENKCAELQSQLQAKNQTVEQQADKICSLEAQLEQTTSNLQGLYRQKGDVESNLTQREQQWEDECQRLNRLNQNALDELGRQVQDLSRTLENVESERNSLVLQITNLTSELQSTQQELTNAESKYSSLQFQQLSTMSASEANRALRDQLREMEMRVARRTEQIGIHQHDIRRLETNLRLQEERLGEMTTELDTLAAQKDAMVEDCADAREARDAALSRVESLEMEFEVLDGKLEQSEQALVSLVAVFVQTVSQAKNTVGRVRQEDANIIDGLRAAYDYQQTLLRTSEGDKRSLVVLQQRLQDSDIEIRQMGISLAMSRSEVKAAISALDKLKEEKNGAEAQFRQLSTQYEDRYASASAELETSRLESAQHTHRIGGLEARILELLKDAEGKASDNKVLLNELSYYKEQLKVSLGDQESGSAEKTVIETALNDINFRHAEEVKTLQEEINSASEALKQLQSRLTFAETAKEQMASDFAGVKQELEKRIESLSADRKDVVNENLSVLHAKHEDELSRLRDNLNSTRLDNESARERICTLESSYQLTLRELAETHETHRAELARLSEEAQETKENMKKDFTVLDAELRERLQALAESSRNVERLTADLEQMGQDRSHERKEHDQHIHRVEAQLQTAESALEELKDRMHCITRELDESHVELGSLQKERLSLQECMTNLEAELQRSISMTRFLESKVKECEETIAGLNTERDLQREELLSIEKSWKAAEVNLSLQSAQNKRETAELQKDIDILRSKPDLAAALVELEERNIEMEELLRKKCAEIEENDDKVLEILKDNKKLTTKVESLNRKVQNLQAKLSAAKASIPKPLSQAAEPDPLSLPAASVTPTATQNSTPIQEQPSIFSKSMPAATTSHAASVGSAVVGAKTPEARLAHPTVFKAKSPDKHTPSSLAPHLEGMEQVIGKKRRAPEDFEACDSLPPQGFTIDSVPDDRNENRTPRVRRMLSGGLNGFTPVRRTHTSQPSPKRATSTATKTSLISDVTNSPRGTSQGSGKGKRSWLGKIRGTTSNSTARAVSSRKASERRGDLS